MIKAKNGKKSYSCKLMVKKLSKKYATVNGKKVKVGGKVKITYTIAADKAIGNVSAYYYYYGDQLKIVTSPDDESRFTVWAYINGFEDLPPYDDEDKAQYKNMVKGKKPLYCFHQCWGINPKDPMATQPYAISCKKGKEFDSFYVKVLKSGNFTFKSIIGGDTNGKTVKIKVTETIK